MNGYLLNFYKYSPQGKNPQFTNAYDENFIRSVVWSSFDRLEIKKISEFAQYRKSGFGEQNWAGERQFAMLYDVSDKENPARLDFSEQPTRCAFPFRDKAHPDKMFRFFGVSMLDLSQEFCSYIYSQDTPGKTFRKEFLNAFDQIINVNQLNDNNNLCYDVYCTLGGNDLVVIWLSDQFKNVMSAIEALRKSRTLDDYQVLTNASTIMGIYDPDVSFTGVEGKLNIRLTKTDTFHFAAVKNRIEKSLQTDIKNYETILGEHDLFFSINGSDLNSNIYKEEGGFIHIRNTDYSDNFMQANTEISVSIEYDELKPSEFDFRVDPFKKDLKTDVTETIKETINTIIKKPIFTQAPYLQETLWILYEDYLKNFSSLFSHPWIHDLTFYFESILQYISVLADSEFEKKPKYELVDHVVTSMRHMLLHVSQANRLFFEIPNTHLTYTGTYSKILRAYQGIVKSLLDLAYHIPKFSPNATVIPAITFDITPITVSLLCENLNGADSIIRIKLPYEALIDIQKYALLLAHEIYHYIPPKDRRFRNTIFGAICVSIIFTQTLLFYIEESVPPEFLNDEKAWGSVLQKIQSHLEPYLLYNIVRQYDDIISDVFTTDNASEKRWDDYFIELHVAYTSNISKSKERINLLFKQLYHFNFGALKDNAEDLGESEKNLLNRAVNQINRQIDKESFENWIVKLHSGENRIDKDIHIQYAIREALADYFMIQTTGIKVQEYLQLILKYREMLSENYDIRQDYRLIMVLKYVFGIDVFDADIKQVLKADLKEHGLDNKNIAFICDICLGYRLAIRSYHILIQTVFKSLEFSEIEADDTSSSFETKKDSLHKIYAAPNDCNMSKFEANVFFVEKFQKQKDFSKISPPKELNPKNNPYKTTKKIFFDECHVDIIQYDASFKLDTREELCTSWVAVLKKIKEGIEALSEPRKKNTIWFRGQEDSSYKLLPSLYRMKDGKYFYDPKFTKLRPALESLYKLFRVKSFGSPEIFSRGNDSVVGTLSSMQHYKVPTNILDWSTSVFVALYFAVEKHIENTEQEVKTDADIWLLNPVRLNLARNYLSSTRGEDNPTEKPLSYPIPSIYGTESEYQTFLPFAKNDSDNKFQFPVAIYVPFVNPRIKAQVGTFTMFSLDDVDATFNHEEKNYSFAEYDLLTLQNKYKKKADTDYKPFLERVTISKECVNEVANWLRQMGIQKSNIYPDLDNIGENIASEFKSYIEDKTNEINS